MRNSLTLSQITRNELCCPDEYFPKARDRQDTSSYKIGPYYTQGSSAGYRRCNYNERGNFL